MVLLYIILFGGIKKYSVILIRIWCWGDDLVRESRLGRTIEQGRMKISYSLYLGLPTRKFLGMIPKRSDPRCESVELCSTAA